MPKRTVRDEQVLTLVERLTTSGSEPGLISALRDAISELLPESTCAVATRVTAHGADHLMALAHRALIEGATIRDSDALAITGGEPGYPAVVVAVTPAPPAEYAGTLAQWAGLAARLLPGIRALDDVSRAVPHQSAGSEAPVEQQLELVFADATARDLQVVLGLVDQSVCPLVSEAQLPEQRRRLVRRLRRMLRPEDRVWEHGNRVLVAQILPAADTSLLVDRINQAIRATHAEEGFTRRLVDVWVTTGDNGLAAAEEALARLRRMRDTGRRCLAGEPEPFDLIEGPELTVVVDNHRSILGINGHAAALLAKRSGGSVPEVTELAFFRPDGSQVGVEELPGRTALSTGVSTQDRVLGLRYRGGRVHWGLLCTAAFDDGHGSVAGYVASVTSLVGPDGDQRSLRDAMELCRDPMALMEPVGDAAEIKDFRVLRANSRALTMLRMREEDLLGASETEIYPFETRLGLVLDYAQVLATGDSSQRVVTMPAGPLAGTYQISAMPCYGNVMVVARGLGDGRQAWDSARVWDRLTGLNNREGLLKQLREFDQDGDQPVTLALLDIDDFTGVNDLLGRLRSDRFLIEVGRILSEIAGAQDLVARIGNDEFAILTTTIGSRAQADAFGDLIRTRMKRGVSVGGQHFTAAASIGVAWTGDGDRVGELLAVADAAMAESKAGGGDAVTLGHRERRTPAMRAVAMETELRDAIEEQQFVLHYQPVIDLASGRIRGAEALIRWQHPQRGTVPPAEFIGVAERRHLITRIGEWVVEEAFGQLARWRSSLGYVPALALNTSIGQLTRPGLARTILQCAEREGIDPHSIQLEITESQLLHADDSTLANLHACQEAGCELAIDDFGTGHAGFDYLRQIPARVLKVDKTFIDGLAHDTTDGAIVAGVIALGHGLGLSVIAEGVETEEQAQALRALNCDAGQGWLWHPALPAEDLEALLLAGDVTG